MGYNLLRLDRDQSYLMAPSLREWLPEGDLAWAVLDAVDQLDLRECYSRYRADGWGAAAYDPQMMVALLLYAYCRGVRSSRKIAEALERDVGFRVVAANQQPDFRTVCRFRAEHQAALEQLFVQVLRLCHEAGLVRLGVVALDGTKVSANASLGANRTHRFLQEEVQQMLAEAMETDAAEDVEYGLERRGDEPPSGLGRRHEHLEREAAAEAAAAREHLKVREAEEEEEAGIAGRPRVAVADAGYWSQANAMACAGRPDLPEVLVATTKDWKQRKAARERGCPRGRIPKALSLRERMERKQLTQRGRRLYRLRGQTVEPGIGQIEEVQGFRRCQRRGRDAAEGEAVLVGTCHNLLKLWQSGRMAPLSTLHRN